MKSIITYITESKKSFNISSDDREALATLLGFAVGDLGDDDDIAQFELFVNDLSEDEKICLQDLSDLFGDTNNYPKITHMNLNKEEKLLINKFLNYIEDNCDNLLDEYSYEIGNLEEIFL